VLSSGAERPALVWSFDGAERDQSSRQSQTGRSYNYGHSAGSSSGTRTGTGTGHSYKYGNFTVNSFIFKPDFR
jgi:hypothetical protein